MGATSGPGATNLVTGIATAQMDSIPLLVITGQVPTNFLGSDAFQETDIFGITLPIVKHSYKVMDANNMLKIISEAFYLARNGRPGPVLVDIPKDVGTQKIESYNSISHSQINVSLGYRFKYKISQNLILSILHLVQNSFRPLFYVGGGVITSNAYSELSLFAHLFNIPVTTTLMGKGAFDEKDELSIGMLGMHGTAYANFAVSECDLLLAVGARFDDRVTGKLDLFANNSKIIHFDIDPAEIGKNKIPTISILGDIKRILQELLTTYKVNEKFNKINVNHTNWIDLINSWKKIYPLMVPKKLNTLLPQQVISNINKYFPNAFFTTDVGQHQMWAAQFVNCSPRKWASSAGLGTMGFGLPAAIGVQFAFPKNQVICITGDSSVQMCIQELGTISQYNLPIRVVILNNKFQGMVRQWQESFYQGRYSHSKMEDGQPNFVTLARSYGIEGITITNEKNMQDILISYRYKKKPIIFNFITSENENCYPMVSPNNMNAVMDGINYKKNELDLLKNYTGIDAKLNEFIIKK